jgi:hypothetical protein
MLAFAFMAAGAGNLSLAWFQKGQRSASRLRRVTAEHRCRILRPMTRHQPIKLSGYETRLSGLVRRMEVKDLGLRNFSVGCLTLA